MKRFPDSVKGKAFYEKDAPQYTPDWIHTANVPRVTGGQPIRYVCIDDLPTLVWCANIASLELHPFLHRAGQLNCPDSMVFDLDPGEGTDLATCAEIGFHLKELLEQNELNRGGACRCDTRPSRLEKATLWQGRPRDEVCLPGCATR
jgi:bifunctional non-homologous end joining protein LigD